MNSFTNPYLGLDETETHRLQTRISSPHRQFFWSIRSSNGTFVIMTNLLVSKLHDELTRRGITDLTHQAEFESFVANCKLVLPNEIDLAAYGQSATTKQLFPVAGLKPGNNLKQSLHGSTIGGVDQKADALDDNRRVKKHGGKVQSAKTK